MMCCRGHPEAPIQLATCLSPLGSPTSSATSLHCLDYSVRIRARSSSEKFSRFFCRHEFISSPATLTVCLLAPASHTFTIINHSWVIPWEEKKEKKNQRVLPTGQPQNQLMFFVAIIIEYLIKSHKVLFLLSVNIFFPASLISLNFIIKLSSFNLC